MTNVAQILTINGKSVDGVLGTRTQCGRMEGADESTELWRHPKYWYVCKPTYLLLKLETWHLLL